MRLLFPIVVLILISVGCKPTESRKSVLLDSLKKAYADKPIHITLRNNEARTIPLSSQYAYVDKNKSDLAFEVKETGSYKLSYEEGLIFVPTTEQPEQVKPDMVLIESLEGTPKKGYISYTFIKEFEELNYYK